MTMRRARREANRRRHAARAGRDFLILNMVLVVCLLFDTVVGPSLGELPPEAQVQATWMLYAPLLLVGIIATTLFLYHSLAWAYLYSLEGGIAVSLPSPPTAPIGRVKTAYSGTVAWVRDVRTEDLTPVERVQMQYANGEISDLELDNALEEALREEEGDDE